MARHLIPLLYTLLVWWFSTGAILYLIRLPQRTHRTTLVLAAALAGLAASSTTVSVASAYCAFTCVVLIWGWQEVAFLLGYVTGPHRKPATPGLRGWPRVHEAFQTVVHHELGLLLLGAAVLATTWEQPNQTGWWTFVVLWVMRQSAKLNLFLGVRNLYESFLPPHLSYLHSYFRRAPFNALFPVSVLASTAIAVPLAQAAFAPGASAAEAAGLSLVGTLLGLAILEHWLLMLPLPGEALWRWATGSRSR
jgi:putative photosynthetic complex assembly protein 2